MRTTFVCLLVAMAVAGSAATKIGEFNFFPSAALPKSADGKPQVLPSPSAWTLEAQTAYPELGNTGEGMLKIAVSDYFPDGPTLYITPGAWCDTAGAAVVGPFPNGLTAKGSKLPLIVEEAGPAAPAEGAAPNAAPADAVAPAAAEEAAPAEEAAAPTAEAMPVEEAAPTAEAVPAEVAAAAVPEAAAAPKVAAAPAAGKVAAAAVPEAAAAPKVAAAPAAAATPLPRRLMQAETEAAPEAAPNAIPMVTTDAAPNAAPADAVAPADAAEAAPAEEAPAAEGPIVYDLESAPAGTLFAVDSDGTCTQTGDVTFKLSDDSPMQVAEKVMVEGNEVFKISLPASLADGPLCVDITATFDTSKVKTTPPYYENFEKLGDSTPFTRTVCLYKLTKQANAHMDFDMCTDNKFMLNISNITPLPVNFTLDDKPVDANLFTPLVKVWGGKVAELDGTPTEPRSYDEVASRTMYNWVAKYFPISPSYSGEPLSYTLSDTLQEGYYEVSSVVSVVTKYPELNSLIGLTQITQEDAAGSQVKGLWEAAARQVHYKTIMGVQKGSTPTTLSKISSSSHVKGQNVLPGQKVVLNWQFRGVGSATCAHDGVLTSNAADSKCVSPLSVDARDVSAVDTKHTVVVTFTDVCGRVRTAEFEYTQAGVRPMTDMEVVAADGSITKVDPASLITEGAKTPTVGSGKAVRSGAAAAGFSALAGAAAVAAAVIL